MDAKAALRAQVRAKVAALSPTRRCAEEDLVTAAIQDAPEWRAARTVLLYRSVAPEFTTVGLANGAWRAGKRVLFPRILAGDAAGGPGLALHQVDAWTQFTGTTHGIPEPGADLPLLQPGDVDLAILPGVAWDLEGGRLGRGAGFYDRLVPQLRLCWGLAFEAQIVPRVPVLDHDQRVHRVWHADGLA